MLTIENPQGFDWANVPLAQCCEGNFMDALFTLKLYHEFKRQIAEKKLERLVYNLISPSLKLFERIEYDGCDVDTSMITQLETGLNTEIEAANLKLQSFKQVVKEDNLVSNPVLSDIFFTRETGFALYPPKRTATGAPSVDAECLETLLEQIEDELEKRAK